MLDITKVREQFPILQQITNGKQLVYLDSAATSQKPLQVIEAVSNFYLTKNANVHRGVYKLSEYSSVAYSEVREKVRNFINAKRTEEIIFVPNATTAINLVASSFGGMKLREGDEVVVSMMEHHSNFVPWQMACERVGAKLIAVPLTETGTIKIDQFEKSLTNRTKIIAITHVSNVLGTINPIKEMIAIAHARNIPILVDGAQAVPHMAVDVQDLDCDFYVFSGHKMYAPTGSGALYGKFDLLQEMPPYQGGGGMIKTVSLAKTTYADLPEKFEAGTPDISGVIGLGAAIDYLHEIGMDNIAAHGQELLQYASVRLSDVKGLHIIGQSPQKSAVISFIFEDIHPHDVGTILDSEGVAVRVGHHCAMPLMDYYNIPATTRVSFGVYNTKQEIDVLIKGLEKAVRIFRG